MICPKCGYTQEERFDCVKCGVVFSKYYALHLTSKPAASAEPCVPAVPPDESETLEIRQLVKQLNRRLNELEFERAQRNHLRQEIKALDLKVQEAVATLSGRFQQIEERWSEFETQCDIDLENVFKRLDLIEEKIELLKAKAEFEPAPDPENRRDTDFAEQLQEVQSSVVSVSEQLSEIEEIKKTHLVVISGMESLHEGLETAKIECSALSDVRIPELEMELHEIKSEVEKISNAKSTDVAPTNGTAKHPPEEDDLRAIRATLEDLRQLILEERIDGRGPRAEGG